MNNAIHIRVVGHRARWSAKVQITGGKDEKAEVHPIELEKWEVAKRRLLKVAGWCFVESKDAKSERLVSTMNPGCLFKRLNDSGVVVL